MTVCSMRNFPCEGSRNLVLNVTHLKKKTSTPNHHNISNYTAKILEMATYLSLTRGISLLKVFLTLQSSEYCSTKAQESYVVTKNCRENKNK